MTYRAGNVCSVTERSNITTISSQRAGVDPTPLEISPDYVKTAMTEYIKMQRMPNGWKKRNKDWTKNMVP